MSNAELNSQSFRNDVNLVKEVTKLQSQIQQLEAKMGEGKWFACQSPEFANRIKLEGNWMCNNDELMMRETEYDITITGIFRQASGHTSPANSTIFSVKNPDRHMLSVGYTPILTNGFIPGTALFSTVYSERATSNKESVSVAILNQGGYGWIMATFIISKNMAG